MGPLRTVDAVGFHFHPAQMDLPFFSLIRRRLDPVLVQCITRSFPLSTLIRALGKADRMSPACSDFNELNADIRVIGVADHLSSSAIRSEVPGVEGSNSGNFSVFYVKPFEREGPEAEDQIASGPEEGFMHNKFLIAMLVKAFHLTRIPPNTMHARSRITGEFDELFVFGMKLGMNNRPGPMEQHLLF